METYIEDGSTIVRNSGYGVVWKQPDGRTFVVFYNRNDDNTVFETTANETVEQFGYTLSQTLGSWGPTQNFRRYLESRTRKNGNNPFLQPVTL